MSEHATDRELLEAAAKAAGLPLLGWHESWADEPGAKGFQTKDLDRWNPLDDDGDALRLAVKLRLCVSITIDGTSVDQGPKVPFAWEKTGLGADVDFRAAATRRAIVRAAAFMVQGADRRDA